MTAINQLKYERGGSKEIEILSEQHNKELKEIRKQFYGQVKQIENEKRRLQDNLDIIEKKYQ